MVGGIIVQIVDHAIEVLDEQNFARCWRWLEHPNEVQVGDSIWWQSYQGMLSRKGEFTDKNIGKCKPCNSHGRESRG